MATTTDPFQQFKALQRETWAEFAMNEGFTTPPAAKLVAFAQIMPGERVLDVGCGTGVVAVTAARAGAKVRGLDLTPALLERARHNASIARIEIDFVEGDAEALPYDDGAFDVVVSQFGHMFAPRPDVATSEMLRVLRPGGRIAFSTWPPEHGMGKLFVLVAKHLPPPLAGAPVPAQPPQWGDPNVIRERLGDRVTALQFDRAVAVGPTLSPNHTLASMEQFFGPLTKLVASLQAQPERLEALRAEILELLKDVIVGNELRQHFLMTRAVKRG